MVSRLVVRIDLEQSSQILVAAFRNQINSDLKGKSTWHLDLWSVVVRIDLEQSSQILAAAFRNQDNSDPKGKFTMAPRLVVRIGLNKRTTAVFLMCWAARHRCAVLCADRRQSRSPRLLRPEILRWRTSRRFGCCPRISGDSLVGIVLAGDWSNLASVPGPFFSAEASG